MKFKTKILLPKNKSWPINSCLHPANGLMMKPE